MEFILFFAVFHLINSEFFLPTNEKFSLIGRFDTSDPKKARFDWTGSTILFQFISSNGEVQIHLDGNNGNNYMNFFLDNSNLTIKEINNETVVRLSASENEWHQVEITKRTETEFGMVTFLGVEADEIDSFVLHSRKFLWLGDSLTTGYGDEGTVPGCPGNPDIENNYVSFDGIVSRHFDAYQHVIAWEGRGLVRNYGEEGHLSERPLPFYLDWVCGGDESCGKYNFSLYQNLDSIFVYLGTNDYTSKKWQPSDDQFIKGYDELIPRLMNYFPNTEYYFFVCGDTLPGKEHPWCDLVEKQYKKWSKKGLKVAFINNSDLTTYPEDEGCDGHPNIHGHMKLANNIISVVKETTGW